MRKKLTKITLEARPPASGRTEVRDTESPLVYRLTSKGARSLSVRTRLHGQQVRFTFPGAATADSLAAARRWAHDVVTKCADGVDPRVEERERRERAKEVQASTYEAVVEQFIEKYAKVRQKTWKETERVLKAVPWSDRPIAAITKREAYELLSNYKAAGHEAKGRVTLAWLKTLWRWAWKLDLVELPIMDALPVEFDRQVRDRRYSDDEVRAVWRAADSLPPHERGFVKLILLLGVRKNELAGMRRSELDDPDNPTLWTVPHERTKTKKRSTRERVYLVPLPPLARRIIKSLPRVDDSDLVFPGRHHGKELDPGTWLKKRVQAKSGVSDWTYHPCRDTIATWLQDQGHSEYERGLVLNHAGSGSVTGDYSHGYPVELKRELLERWAGHVAGLVQPKGAEVLS